MEKGGNLLNALYEQNIILRTDCGGRGICGKCRIYIVNQDGQHEECNSCTVTVEKDMTVEIPLGSMLSPEVIGKAPVQLPEQFIRMMQECNHSADFGLAVDLGTTTIAIYLVNTSSAEILSSSSLKNPQALFGDDVMSRIYNVSEDEANLRHLQTLAVKTIELGAMALLKACQIPHTGLRSMVVVGNPTMIHLFLGVDPQPLGVTPYQPVFTQSRVTASQQIGFEQLQLNIFTLPQISGFIGGDLLSAALAADIEHAPHGTLLIDIGTNGELILKAGSGLYATSCATGPAFEGATLSCGMQAVSGAIDDVIIENALCPPRCTVLSRNGSTNKPKPSGICGSGVVSCLAEMVRTGIVESSGAFTQQKGITHLLKDRSRGHRFQIFNKEESDTGQEISLCQKDIRAIQLGKGALITGIEILLRRAGLEQLERIILAGAFGSHLKPEDLMAIGMIPQMDRSKVTVAGNLAGAGAVMALCDENSRSKADELANSVVTIDLAGDPEFQRHFIKRLSFPPP